MDDDDDHTASNIVPWEPNDPFPQMPALWSSTASTAELVSAIEAIESMYDGWCSFDRQATTICLRATCELWALLGKIYALSPEIEANPAAKLQLIERLRLDKSVVASKKWAPDDKPAYELLVVLFTGINKKTAARKSQWIGSLRSASMVCVPCDEASFVAFLYKVKGIKGALKLLKPRKEREPYDWVVKQLSALEPSESASFLAPDLLDIIDEDEALGLVIVRMEGRNRSAVPIATITDREVIYKAYKAILREVDAEPRESF